MEYSKEAQAGKRKPKKKGTIRKMTPEREAHEKAKRAAYERISETRPPRCEGCESSNYEHSHRFPVGYNDYRYIAEDESIDLYCRECHTNYERGHVWKLNNGEQVMEYLKRTDEEYFQRKLGQLIKSLSKENRRNWKAISEGLVIVPSWATKLVGNA